MKILDEKTKNPTDLLAQIYVLFELQNTGKVLNKSYRNPIRNNAGGKKG